VAVKLSRSKAASVWTRPAEAGLGRLMIIDEAAPEAEFVDDKEGTCDMGEESVVKITSSGVDTKINN
jgi:hypothetical protein